MINWELQCICRCSHLQIINNLLIYCFVAIKGAIQSIWMFEEKCISHRLIQSGVLRCALNEQVPIGCIVPFKKQLIRGQDFWFVMRELALAMNNRTTATSINPWNGIPHTKQTMRPLWEFRLGHCSSSVVNTLTISQRYIVHQKANAGDSYTPQTEHKFDSWSEIANNTAESICSHQIWQSNIER